MPNEGDRQIHVVRRAILSPSRARALYGSAFKPSRPESGGILGQDRKKGNPKVYNPLGLRF